MLLCGLSNRPLEASIDVHGAGVEVPLKTPVPVGFSAKGPFCRTKRAEVVVSLELRVRDRDVHVYLIPEVLDESHVRSAPGV